MDTVMEELSRAKAAVMVSHTLACRYDGLEPYDTGPFSENNPFVACLMADTGRLRVAQLARIELMGL